MTENQAPLPQRVEIIQLGERTVYLVGTAHVSKESVEDVRRTIEAVSPDTVCVELCQARYTSLTDKESWKKMDLFKIIKEKKSVFLLAQLIMTSFYRRLGDKLGVEPGAEMLEGVKLAKERDAKLVLADRDIQITLKRVWRYLSFWDKLKLFFSCICSIFSDEKIDEDTIEKLKQSDQLEAAMAEFTEAFPQIKERLISERDVFLSQKIRTAPGNIIVAVIGAAHIPGIKEHIDKEIPLAPIMELPEKSIVPTILKWAIPILIMGLLAWGFIKGGAKHGTESILIWILINGILSALGAAIAFAHPLAIIASFLAAPLTSLNPMLAAGWVSGLVQAWIKKPTVTDFEDLPNAMLTFKGFWMNPVIRVLLVVAMANLGSVLGTYISGVWIAARTL